MALAYVRLSAQHDDFVELLVQLGTSEFFEYRIGSAAGSHPFGGEPLADEVHRSELLRRRAANDGSAQLGGTGWGIAPAFSLRVPSTLFTREHRQLQVVSFRDRERTGPAFSKAVTVMTHGLDTTAYDRGLPARATSLHQGAPALSQGCRRVSIGFSESGLSHAQFVDSLLGALRALAPSLLESLPELIAAVGDGAEGRAGADGSAAANQSASGLDSDALLGLLRQLVEHLPGASSEGDGAAGTSAGPPPPPLPPPAPGAAVATDPAAEALAGEQSLRARGWASATSVRARALVSATRRRAKLGQAMNFDLDSPAGLATLIAPFLESGPQVLRVFGDRPLDLLALLLRSQLGGDVPRDTRSQPAVHEWCRQRGGAGLLGEVLHNRVLPALSAQQSQAAVPGQFARGVALQFELGAAVDVGGRTRCLYQAQRGCTLRARLRFSRPAPAAPLERAIARVRFVDPALDRAVFEREFQLRNVQPTEALSFHFEPSELAAVPRGRDLHVEATLRWPGKRGVVAVRGDHAVLFCDGLLFGRLGRRLGAETPLADPSVHRAFWNKVWEGGSDEAGEHSRWELDATLRYYVRLTGNEADNGRMDTRMWLQPSSQGNTLLYAGRLRSGMELSLAELNRLNGGGHLSTEELDALRSADLSVLDQAATAAVKVRGKARARGAVWAFVSVQPRELLFFDVAQVNEDGQVTELSARPRRLPLPASIHFLTMRSR